MEASAQQIRQKTPYVKNGIMCSKNKISLMNRTIRRKQLFQTLEKNKLVEKEGYTALRPEEPEVLI